MKIDLHLHTKASTSNGDSIIFKSVNDSVTKLFKNNIKMAAFTDHNVFNVKIFKEARDLGKTGNIIFLPGIEVNVTRKSGEIAHMLILFREDLDDDDLNEIALIAKNRIWKSGISLKNINSLYENFETIRIIHIGKTDHFIFEDLENLDYDAFETTNFENKNYKRVYKKIKKSVVSFSDTHFWDSYPQVNILETFISGANKLNFDILKKEFAKNKIFSLKRK